MNKWIVIAISIFLIIKVATSSNDTEVVEEVASTDNEVVLYATSWCGYCAKTREWLSENSIEYTEYDVENSEEGRAQYDEIGESGVPVLNVNGTIVSGYNPSKIKSLLNY